eukprot:1154237-Pelagomonas_calceolata.AAC.10
MRSKNSKAPNTCPACRTQEEHHKQQLFAGLDNTQINTYTHLVRIGCWHGCGERCGGHRHGRWCDGRGPLVGGDVGCGVPVVLQVAGRVVERLQVRVGAGGPAAVSSPQQKCNALRALKTQYSHSNLCACTCAAA